VRFSDKFIKAGNEYCDMEKFVAAPYFRKSFNLKDRPSKAEITVCGLGFYELYINGENITKAPLAPYINNPEAVLYYDNYDISNILNEGENVIGVLLGNGMRNPYGGFMWDFDKAKGRGAVTFALCLEAKTPEESIVIEADESFKTHSSPIKYDDLRMGYYYDSRLEIKGWNTPCFNDEDWGNAIKEKTPKGEKRLCEVEPIIIEKELKAVDIKYYERHPFAHNKWGDAGEAFEDTYRDNVYVYDFGINTAGVTKLKVNGKPGQKIIIRHGEETVRGEFSINTTVFQRGEVNSRRYRDYAQVDTFVCKGGYEEFVPKFKYDGFRYAYVEGLEKEQATKDAVTYLVMHSDIERRADFKCSDEVLNKLYSCTINSDYSNFYYFPTDCPHREKLGWTGDAWFSAEQMLLNLKSEKSLREWLFNIRKSQLENGAIPCIIPTVNWGYEWGSGPVFDAICGQLPYYIYKYTGDKAVIRENADMIIKYFKYVSEKRDDDGLLRFGLGDWTDPFEDERGYISAPLEFTASITIYDTAKKAEFMFEQAGLKGEQMYAKKLAEELKNSIRDTLIDYETMTVKGDCQTSQTLAVAHGIFNDDEIESAKKRLVEIIHRDGDINCCGILGIRYLFKTLTDIGESELAYKIVTSTEPTCYGYWIENGATSLWERFKKVDDIKSDNSKNHHFHGNISSWFIQELAGLKPNPHGSDVSYFEISPSFIEKLDFAKAYYDSCFGKVEVEWKRCGEEITLCIIAPKGTKGVVKNKGEIIRKWDCQDGINAKLTVK